MSDNTVISTSSLSKRYGDTLAVDTLNLDVRAGEVYGFLGRNGAGKTTSIRMLLGLVRPTNGDVRILGSRIKPGETRVFGRVGYLVESSSAYPNLTVTENLEIQRLLTRSTQADLKAVIQTLGLTKVADRQAGKLSLGNKQRLSLARALLHEPDVLVLDEPANALDPAGIVEVRRLLRMLADQRGVTVFMSSHILAEVAHLADRIGIIHDGRLLEELDRDELEAKAQTFVVVKSSDPSKAERVLREAGVSRIECGESTDELHVFEWCDRVPEIARRLVNAGIELEELAVRREDLETYFLRLTKPTVPTKESS